MTKILVDSQTNKIRGTYLAPLNFSISGRYVIDVPDSVGVQASTDSVSDLISAKTTAFIQSQGMVDGLNDELLTTPNIDSTKSYRYGVGPNKRSLILQQGWITTNILTITPAFTQIFAHWYAFLFFPSTEPTNAPSTPAPPALYNWDTVTSMFTDFDPNIFLAEVRDTTDTSTLFTLSPDVKVPFAGGPNFNFRLRFTNNDPNHIWYLSDWTFLYQ